MARPPLRPGTHGKVRARQLPSGRWRAVTTYRDHSGRVRRVERVGGTETVARNAVLHAATEAARTDGQFTPDTRFSSAAAHWLADLTGRRAATTTDLYRVLLNHHALPALGHLQLRDITPYRVDRFLHGLEQQGLSPASRRNVRKVLAGPLGLATRYGALPANPVRDAGRIEGGARRPRLSLTRTEVADLIRELAGDDQAEADDVPELVRFMLGTGMRLGEALAVRWCDVSIGGQPTTVTITGNVVRVRGHGLQRNRGKTPTALRTLTLPAAVATMLAWRRARHPDTSPEATVFGTATGRLRDPAEASKALRGAFNRAGYPGLTSHAFRRIAALRMDEAKLSARQVADQLGHARVSMTHDYYLPRGVAGDGAAAALEE